MSCQSLLEVHILVKYIQMTQSFPNYHAIEAYRDMSIKLHAPGVAEKWASCLSCLYLQGRGPQVQQIGGKLNQRPILNMVKREI